MFCSKCGKQIKDGAKFCPFCGAPQQAVPMPGADGIGTTKSHKGIIIASAALGAAVICALALFLFWLSVRDFSAARGTVMMPKKER